MRIIRPIRASDLEKFMELAFMSGIGVISLPKNEERLKEKLYNSLQAFSPEHKDRKNLIYLFVMEELETGQLIGICGIRGSSGGKVPSYYFAVGTEPRIAAPHRPREMRILYPVHYTEGPSEICSLYLHPEKRKGGWGRFLSFSRFLFIADHLDRFSETIIAEMRGHLEGEGSNPFWDAVGRHFYDLPLQEVLKEYSINADFLPDILPSHPIYVDLLPPDAQIEIGTVHDRTLPALKMLMEQGFKLTNEVDIIDGGPKIEATTQEIDAIKQSSLCAVVEISSQQGDTQAIISNTSLNFRAVQGMLNLDHHGNALLTTDLAQALEVNIGDTIRYYKMGQKKE